ncbi:unnamed protein product [Paramecium pentaurelia]|uniref:Uncharacterized protein n=1 Tax=Paramecium pentaurelia TaxID=43138 RepID=A0A8S1V6Y4_9CILI|nr:unnamed protein product [Paramecium pentaurelia]
MSQVMLVLGPSRVGKSSLIDALTYGQFHREFYPQDIDFQVKLAKVAQHRVYEVQSIEWDGKPFGLVQFYSNVADLILIVVNICGCYDQMDQIHDIYQALPIANNKQQIVLIGNLNGQNKRNEKLCQSLSTFAKLNDLKLYELDSTNIMNVQMEFSFITQPYSLFDDIWNRNQNYVTQFVSQAVSLFI